MRAIVVRTKASRQRLDDNVDEIFDLLVLDGTVDQILYEFDE